MSITLTTPVTYTDPMSKAQVSCACISMTSLKIDLQQQSLQATFAAGNVTNGVFIAASGFAPVSASLRTSTGAVSINNSPQAPLSAADLTAVQSAISSFKLTLETAALAISNIAGTITNP